MAGQFQVQARLRRKGGRRFGRTTQSAPITAWVISPMPGTLRLGGARRPKRWRRRESDVKLVENIADVPVHCLSAEKQFVGDFLVGFTGSDQAEDLQLAGRETAGFLRPHVKQGIDTRNVRRGSKLLERGPGCLQLQYRTVAVAEGAASQAHHDAYARCLVWRVDLLPRLDCPAQPNRRGLCFAVCQFHRSPRVGGKGAQRFGSVAFCNVRQFVAGTPCFLDVAGRQHDLDVSRQQPNALHLVGRRGHDAPDCGRSRIDVPFGQPQHGKARLRFEAILACTPICLLGGVKVSAKAVYFRQLVPRPSRIFPIVRLRQTLHGLLRFVDRVLPCAARAA